MNSDKFITVFGATGTQGNAVAKQLLQKGWQVRAVTRNPDSEKAQTLSVLGANIVRADFDDSASLVKVLTGAYGAYSVQPALTTLGDVGQARWGIAVAEAAWTAQVQHFIYASAVVHRGKGVCGLGSKRAIEERIAELSLPTTILRPAFFMENLTTYFPIRSQADELVLSIPFPLNRQLQMVSAYDIAKMAASAFADPQKYLGQAIEIIGDTLTLNEMAAAWSEASGLNCSAVSMPLDSLAQFWPQGVPLFRFIGEGGCDVETTTALKDTALKDTALKDTVLKDTVLREAEKRSFSEWLVQVGVASAV